MKGKCRFYTIETSTLEYEAQLGGWYRMYRRLLRPCIASPTSAWRPAQPPLINQPAAAGEMPAASLAIRCADRGLAGTLRCTALRCAVWRSLWVQT